MEQLLKVTTTPFQAIHFRQSARLIPADHVTVERQKALARHRVFQSRYRAAVSSQDLEYMNQIRSAFSKSRLPGQNPAPVKNTSSLPGSGVPVGETFQSDAVLSGQGSSAPVYSGAETVSELTSETAAASSAGVSSSDYAAPIQTASSYVPPVSEANTNYTVQRGSFELRVAKGELSYVPPLVMTIITQYPNVHFEYTGGFNYVPPRDDSQGDHMNLSI